MASAITASDPRLQAKSPLLPRAHLFVAMSCHSPLEAPSRHAIDDVDAVYIGRGPAREVDRRESNGRRHLTLTLADRHVSTEHARLLRRDDGWAFEDLGSKNGSAVNGVPRPSATLEDGDCLLIGHTLLIFRRALPTPENAAVDVVATARAPALATLLPRLARELDLLAIAATSSVPVVLVSETGTGKEMLARAVHSLSCRKGDFVPVNCGGLPATLLESILFGHKRGAFSGAVTDHAGLFRTAHAGTLLLDEVGDMPQAAQAAVLRAVHDGEVLPVGATQPTRVDARIVSATHRDLEGLVAQGTFREDLYARLSGFLFRLPPLRERREDIGLLVGVILRTLGPESGRQPSLSPEAGTLLFRHVWRRNVRELAKCIAHAKALAGDGRIEVEHLPQEVREGVAPTGTASDDSVRERLLAIVKESGGNVSTAAKAFQTSRSQVHRWLKRFAIDPRTYRR